MLPIFLWLVSGLPATTYGFSEQRCGNIDKPIECKEGAITASGVKLNPNLPQAAIAIPKNYRVRPTWVCLRVGDRKANIQVIDKMNPRYVGNRSFDLTPRALELLGIKPNKHWSDKIYIC